MRAIGQFTITNICDVIASEVAPENPYVGQLWVNTSASPPLTMVWNGVDGKGEAGEGHGTPPRATAPDVDPRPPRPPGLLGEISITSDTQMTPSLWQKI